MDFTKDLSPDELKKVRREIADDPFAYKARIIKIISRKYALRPGGRTVRLDGIRFVSVPMQKAIAWELRFLFVEISSWSRDAKSGYVRVAIRRTQERRGVHDEIIPTVLYK